MSELNLELIAVYCCIELFIDQSGVLYIHEQDVRVVGERLQAISLERGT